MAKTRKPGELTNVVREYILSLRIYSRKHENVQKPREDSVKFGQKISKKRKKAMGGVEIDEELRASLHAGARTVSKSELAKRKQQAKQAMEQAKAIAGEDVRYCCGNIRRVSSIDYECWCVENEFYTEVNEYGKYI